MWNDSDIIANELYSVECGNAEEESTPNNDPRFVMMRTLTSGMKRDGFMFTWRIENFSSFGKKTGEFLQSPTFLVEKLEKTEWYLRLYPRGDVDENYISCYLYRKKNDDGPEKIVIGYKISFITVDGSPSLSGQVEKLSFARNKGFGNTKFKKREELFKKAFLPRDVLTVRCHMWKCFFEKSMAKECSARTKLDVERCFLTWSIKNFSAGQAGVKQNVPFVPASTKVPPLKIKWYINKDDENIKIDIIQLDKKPTITYVNCKISLQDSKGNRQELIQKDHFFEAFHDNQVWQLPPLIEKSKILAEKEQYLPEDVLTLICELSISLGEETSVIEESSFKPTPSSVTGEDISSTSTLKSDLFSLYTKKKFCDVTLRTPTSSFLAHKSILSARSPIFLSLLEDDKMEETGNTISIADVDDNTLNDMLVYMYSENIDHMTLENAVKLYCAADKYQVISLKNTCSHFLKSILNVANVCLVLALADEHRDSAMKCFIQEFICHNANETFNSKQWKEFMERKSVLAGEIMHLAWKKN